MAQRKSFNANWYLFLSWRQQLASAQRVLSVATELCALGVFVPTDVDRVLALVVRLLGPWSESEYDLGASQWFRPLEQWLCKVDSLDMEIERLAGHRDIKDKTIIGEELHEILAAALRDWTARGAESPSTDEVLYQVTNVLFRSRLIARPPIRGDSEH